MTEEEKLAQEEKMLMEARYRFSGARYSIRGPAGKHSSDQIIPQEPGEFAYPKTDEKKEEI